MFEVSELQQAYRTYISGMFQSAGSTNYNPSAFLKRLGSKFGVLSPYTEIMRQLFLGQQPTSCPTFMRGKEFFIVSTGSPEDEAHNPLRWLSPKMHQHHFLPYDMRKNGCDSVLFVETLILMREKMEKNIPVYVCCQTGNDSSALIIFSFLCYQFLKGDQVIKDLIAQKNEALRAYDFEHFDAEGENEQFGSNLIKSASQFVQGQRKSVVFKNELLEDCLELLEPVINAMRSKTDSRDNFSPDHQFLYELFQSGEYKRLSRYVCEAPNIVRNRCLKSFLEKIIENRDAWADELSDALGEHKKPFGKDHLWGFIHTKTTKEFFAGERDCQRQIRQTLIMAFKDKIVELRGEHVMSDYAVSAESLYSSQPSDCPKILEQDLI